MVRHKEARPLFLHQGGVGSLTLVLGIDTGGTFTDAVLLEQATGEVRRKAKAMTTRADLRAGIAESIERQNSLPV